MSDSLTLYKLIVLYMLDRVDFPLSQSQIYDFMLEREYATFLLLQQAIGELAEAGFVTSRTHRNRTLLFLTKEGRQTLAYFVGQINFYIRKDIDDYFRANGMALRNEISVTSDYTKASSGEYEAHLIARDREITLVDLTLSVPLEETAVSICDNWQEKNQEIYQYLIEQLF